MEYRATAIGPGAMPDVMWQSAALGPYDPTLDRELAEVLRKTGGADPLCRPV